MSTIWRETGLASPATWAHTRCTACELIVHNRGSSTRLGRPIAEGGKLVVCSGGNGTGGGTENVAYVAGFSKLPTRAFWRVK